jgi:hypothetical protein
MFLLCFEVLFAQNQKRYKPKKHQRRKTTREGKAEYQKKAR